MSSRAGILIVLWAATAIAGPAGRVVRVERSGSRASVAPRLCELRGDSGTCVGEEPRVGQTVVVVDERRAAALAQIVEATSFVASCANLWSVKIRALRGAASETEGIGVIDPSIHPDRAHLLAKGRNPPSPSGLSGDDVWRAIDGDGDGDADIVITRYGCDTSGRPVAGGATYCIDVWARTGTRMLRTTQLNFAQCNL